MFDVGDLPVLTSSNCALKAGVIKSLLKRWVRFNVFLLFFKIQKKHDFLRFLLLHTFLEHCSVCVITMQLDQKHEICLACKHHSSLQLWSCLLTCFLTTPGSFTGSSTRIPVRESTLIWHDRLKQHYWLNNNMNYYSLITRDYYVFKVKWTKWMIKACIDVFCHILHNILFNRSCGFPF